MVSNSQEHSHLQPHVWLITQPTAAIDGLLGGLATSGGALLRVVFLYGDSYCLARPFDITSSTVLLQKVRLIRSGSVRISRAGA